MIIDYVLVKFFHILIAILALGTSAGLGIVLEFYGDHPAHGAFVLRAVERVVAFFVVPGYVLVLFTGLWMAHLAWPWTAKWIQAAFALWCIGAALLGLSIAVLRKQVRVFNSQGPASAVYQRSSLLGRGLGAGTGLVIILILYLMVFKPVF